MISINDFEHPSEPIEIAWLVPDSLQIDDDLDAENDEKYFTDNLVIKVRCFDSIFEVSRRFLIKISKDDVSASPEYGWDWDEHNDLNQEEAILFSFIQTRFPHFLSPPQPFLVSIKTQLEC